MSVQLSERELIEDIRHQVRAFLEQLIPSVLETVRDEMKRIYERARSIIRERIATFVVNLMNRYSCIVERDKLSRIIGQIVNEELGKYRSLYPELFELLEVKEVYEILTL